MKLDKDLKQIGLLMIEWTIIRENVEKLKLDRRGEGDCEYNGDGTGICFVDYKDKIIYYKEMCDWCKNYIEKTKPLLKESRKGAAIKRQITRLIKKCRERI